MIIFFFFFFGDLYNIPDIQQAFKNVCLDKMLCDGYFDMSTYIYGRLKKADMFATLSNHKSKYAVLYKAAYPKRDDAYDFWTKNFNTPDESQFTNEELSYEDSIAIVNWVYQVLSGSEERTAFTRELLGQIKELNAIKNRIAFKNGVLYNSETIDLHICKSIASVSKLIVSLNTKRENLFFRGHSNANYLLQPSVMRSPKLYENENRLYNDLLIECPADFEKCHSHFEKLVKMQHYGLPTRLLDITRNLLVALYFACSANMESFGELIVLSSDKRKIKYPQSDTISILASLPTLSHGDKQQLFQLANDPAINNPDWNSLSMHLIHEIRSEKPAFEPKINKTDLMNNYIVYAYKDNNRIIKQDGAFILCGLSTDKGALESFRVSYDKKRLIILLDKKKSILEELQSYSINHATLFPEIECVAEYLKNKYSNH